MSIRRLLAVGALALAAAVSLPAPAQAVTYRYWSYWIGDGGAWAFSSVGPAFRTPVDGAVEGWRFGEAGVSGDTPPSVTPSFDAVCAETELPADGKRIALVVDPGTADEAPEGETAPGMWAMCVTADADATGYAVLRAAAEVRIDRGLICGIGGYPSTECAVVISDPTPTPTKTPKPKPKPTSTPTTAPATQASESASSSAASPEASSAQRKPSAASSSAAASATASATPEATVSPTPDAPSPTAPPSPSPSLSVLAEPLPPAGGGGSGSALGVGAAVVGICALGGAAVVMMRRRPS